MVRARMARRLCPNVSKNCRQLQHPVRQIAVGLLALTTFHSGAAFAQPKSETASSTAPTQIDNNAARWHLVPAVLPAYQPETSLMVGGAAVLAQELPAGSTRRESQLLLAGAVSVRKQYSGQLAPDLYLFNDAVHLGGLLSAARFPDYFFGIGNNNKSGNKESYTPVYYESELSPKLRIFNGFYAGPSVRVHHASIVSKDDDGQLSNGSIPGSDGGTSVEVGITAFWDTRDRTLYPQNGGLLRTRLATARDHWGSDFDYDNLRIDGRYYLSMPWKRHVLALEQLIDLRRGHPPFYSLGRLGGSEMMRGYYEGKYRDRQYVATQFEYRFPIIWRFGAVAFAAAGTVSDRVRDLRVKDLKAAGGAGLRLAPITEVPVNIRLDVAYGDEVNFYFGIGESF